MGSCNSADNIAKGHIHTEITTCNTEEPHLSVLDFCVWWGGGGLNILYWIQTFGPHAGFLTHQHNKQITNKAYPYSWPRVIKFFSCSTQMSMEFFLLINVKMPTIVGTIVCILTLMSRKNSMLGLHFFCKAFQNLNFMATWCINSEN